MLASTLLLSQKCHNVIRSVSSVFCTDIDTYCLELFNYINKNFTVATNDSHKKTIISNFNNFTQKFNLVQTKKQLNLIEELRTEGYVIIYPYQPNLFPSVAVFAPFVHMEQIKVTMQTKYNIKIVPVYLIIDYDNVMDKRFSRFYLPYSLNSTGKLYYHYQIPKSLKNDIMRSVPLDDNSFVKWLDSIRNNILPNIKAIFGSSLVDEHFKQLEAHIRYVLKKAKTLAEFNELFLYKLLVEELNMPVLFIEGHTLYNNDVNILESIIGKEQEIIECIKDLPKVADTANINFSLDNLANIYIWKYQSKCKSRCNYKTKCYSNCVGDCQFPNVLMDYLIDYIYYNKCGAVGYYKQAEMTIISDWIVNKVYGIAPCPQLLSYVGLNTSKHQNCDRGEIIISSNYYDALTDPHCSILYFILLWGLDGLYEQIKESKIIMEE